jgi:phosphate transport system substrate-binding protein
LIKMNGSLRLLHIALNIGGIIASVIGIVCVVKVAFIRPWQMNMAQAANSVTSSAIVTSKEVAGQVELVVNPPADSVKNAASAAEKVTAPVVKQRVEHVPAIVLKPQETVAEAPLPQTPATTLAETIKEAVVVMEVPPVGRSNDTSLSIYERLKDQQIEVNSPKKTVEGSDSSTIQSQVSNAPVAMASTPVAAVGPNFGGAPSVMTSSPSVDEKDFAPSQDASHVIKGQGVTGKFGADLMKAYLQKLGYLNPRTEMKPGVVKVIAQSSAAKFSEEICVELRDMKLGGGEVAGENEVTIGFEGGGVIVHPYNPLHELTIEEVAAIFSGNIKDWRPFGESTKPIQVCVCRNETGGIGLLEDLVLKPAMLDFWVDNRVVACDTVAEVSSYVAANPHAVGLVPFHFSDPGVKVVAIKATKDSLALVPGTFTVDTYALGRLVKVFQAPQSNDFSSQFLSFVLSREGQELVTKSAFPVEGFKNNQLVASHQAHYKSLMADEKVLQSYKNVIRGHNRLNSPFNLLFKNGEMVLTDESELRFKRISKGLSSRGGEVRVAVIGFSDALGDFKANQTLSRQRADVVKERFLHDGITDVKAVGYGEEMSVGDNETETGRSMNRRVEVWIGN